MYDRTGQILLRNPPLSGLSEPEDLPFNDPETEVDEEAAEIEHILRALRADLDSEVAIRIGEIMFRRLGRADFATVAEEAGVDLSFVLVPGPVETIIPEGGGEPQEVASPILIPDLTQVLPLEGLVALVQRAVQFGGQGSASTPNSDS